MKKEGISFKNIEDKKTISGEDIEKGNAILFQALCDNSLTGVFILNNNKLQYCNKTFNEIFGYENGELIGVSPEELVISEDHGILKEKNNRRLSGEFDKVQYEIRAKCKNGDTKNIIVFGSIIKINGKRLLVGNIFDITTNKELEERLLKSEARLYSAFKATGFGIYEQEGVINESNHISFLDDRARYLLGIKEGEDNNWRDYWLKNIHPDYYKYITDSIFNFNFNGLDLDSSEYKYNHPELGDIWLRHIVHKVKRNEKGQITDMIGVLQDITIEKESKLILIESNKQIQENESRLQLATQSAQLGIWEWNIENGDNTWSDRIYELLGIDKSEKINIDSLTDLIHPDDKEKFKQANLLALEGKEKYDIEVRMFRSDGNMVYVKSNAIVIRNDKGNPIRMIGTCRDITEQINTEKELIAAKERAEESDKLKSAFIKNMSHEVRTPLNSIIGFSKLISQPNNNNKDLEEYSSQIQENTGKLIAIIDDIIEISKIYAGQVHAKLNPFDFTQLIKDIVYEWNYKAIEKNIKLDLTIEMPSNEYILNSDKAKIEEILNHIIDNSIKFTDKGGVEINCKVNNKNLKISITDTGIGIPEDMQQIVFEPFRQVECGTTRKYGGNGLGLTLAKAHTGLLNGSITLESKLNKGTKVMISLPIKD